MLLETDSKILNGHIDEAQLIRFEKKLNKKRNKQHRHEEINRNHLNLKKINPLTENQRLAFKSWNSGYNLMLHGLAGTGKSYVSLYLALKEILSSDSQYKNIVIVRSAVPTRDIGFLPGSVKDKTKIYELPYQTICTDLFGRGDAYELLKTKRVLDFMTTSFIRGNTFYDTIVIADEVNNMNFHELDSIITRLGENCRLMMCGDYRQSDLNRYEKNDLLSFIRILDDMKGFSHVEFQIEDIVRSGIVKEYIIAKHKHGIT